MPDAMMPAPTPEKTPPEACSEPFVERWDSAHDDTPTRTNALPAPATKRNASQNSNDDVRPIAAVVQATVSNPQRADTPARGSIRNVARAPMK